MLTMGRREIVAGLLGLLLLPACGAAARAAAQPPVTRPATTPAPAPTQQQPPPAVSFTGTITRTPAAAVRFGPGLDMPVMDLEPAGRAEVFDGWTARAG